MRPSMIPDGNLKASTVPLISLFKRAFITCPLGHFCHGAARTALAMTDHAPFMLNHNLGAVQIAAMNAEKLLLALTLGSVDLHENHVVALSPQLHARPETCPGLTGRISVTLDPPDKDPWSFSAGLLCRFARTYDLDDLQQAISTLDASVKSGSPRDPQYIAGLANLGVGLSYRFQFLGDLNDLEQAITNQQNAIGLITDDQLYCKPHLLDNLGESFRVRFQYLNEPSDLEKAISMQEDAVRITHSRNYIHLNHLGNSYLVRFEHFRELSDLNQAIIGHRKAVALIRDDDEDMPHLLDDLGNSLRASFQHLKTPGHIKEAVSTQRHAVQHTPLDHPCRPIRLNHLGITLKARFECLGILSDLELAVLNHREAVDLIPDHHPDRPRLLSNLGDSLRALYDHSLNPDGSKDLEQAMSLYSHATLAPTGPASIRCYACEQWISCARTLKHDSLLHAYSCVIDLLHQLAWIGLSLTHRYNELIKVTDVVREAAAAALDAGHPETAVEWLEQGRSIVWGEFFQLRSSYDKLSAAYPDHARRLRQLSAALQRAVFTHEKSLAAPPKPNTRAKPTRASTLEQVMNQHQILAAERDKLLQEIRRLPGFEQYLIRKELAQLRVSAHAGPVVILNAAQRRCDALVIVADLDHVIHVRLRNFTIEQATKLQESLKNSIHSAREILIGKRVGIPVRQNPNFCGQWESILSTLWKSVVKPVLDALSISVRDTIPWPSTQLTQTFFGQTPGNQTRIFWCPTGPLMSLPLHAAGLYDKDYSEPGHKVFDYVVSSYAPTVRVLASPPLPQTKSSDSLRFLVVHQPPSDGLPPLPGVNDELGYIKSVIKNSPAAPTTLLEPPNGRVGEVLELMKRADWVHFACHGVQDTENLVKSGLCLADGRCLMLSDIFALSRPRGGLAFLSACQTAKGDKRLRDEAAHIAAGMLFAGFGSVVGTLWSISDRLAPDVARVVYEQLFQTGTMPDARMAAHALHVAIKHLRERGASFEEWLPFIHMGL